MKQKAHWSVGLWMCVRPKNHQQPLLQRLTTATINVLKGGVGDDLSIQHSQVEIYQLKAKDLHLAESDFFVRVRMTS